MNSVGLEEQQELASLPNDQPVCNVALLGFGTVGRSVAKILSERAHRQLRLTHIFNRNVEGKRVAWVRPEVHWTENFEEILASNVDIVVELVGGLEPAGDWIRRALRAGKSVVTANKQLIAHCGPELHALAARQGLQLAFGAAVAGGVPVVSGLREGLAGDRLLKLFGILNGTCNFIFSKMESAGLSLREALLQAQELGYAEADPTDDIEGYDARAKLAILMRVGLRAPVDPTQIACQSIAAIQAVDFQYARELGCTIRQVSHAELQGERLLAAVRPALVPPSSPLAHVRDNQNLVEASGEYGGEIVFSGAGAGGDPTAVAVVSDLVSIARRESHILDDVLSDARTLPVTADFTSSHYLRFVVKDRPGIIAALAEVLAKHGINIDAVLQKPGYPKARLPFVFTLEACRTSAIERALQEMGSLSFLVERPLALPILQ